MYAIGLTMMSVIARHDDVRWRSLFDCLLVAMVVVHLRFVMLNAKAAEEPHVCHSAASAPGYMGSKERGIYDSCILNRLPCPAKLVYILLSFYRRYSL